jgi:hypothetical protein
MSAEINTIRQANDRLVQLGEKRRVFTDLKTAKATVAQVEKRRLSRDPNQPNGRDPHPIDAKGTAATKKEILIKAIQDSNDPSVLADLYAKLSALILNELKTVSDPAKRTELTREYQRSEKNRGYSLMAESQLNPGASKSRKFLANLDR